MTAPDVLTENQWTALRALSRHDRCSTSDGTEGSRIVARTAASLVERGFAEWCGWRWPTSHVRITPTGRTMLSSRKAAR